jgi:hypothetical protein
MTFSEYFRLNASQGELDFVNVDPARDIKLFVDPYAIQINALDEDDPFYDCLLSFFSTLLDCLRLGDNERAKVLVGHLKEPKDTFLGYSKGKPRGHGVGDKQAMALIDAIRRSEAFRTGQLEDFSEAELFVEGVGPDKISDLSTNVLRQPLMSYTKSVCDIYDVQTRNVAMPPYWDAEEERWKSGYAEMPLINNLPVLLVPKSLVRRRLCLDSQEYYNYYLDYLQAELEPQVSLASALRGKSGRVTKERVKEQYPFDKTQLAKFAQEHPGQFENFKQIMKSADGIDDNIIDPDFVYSEATSALSAEIRSLPSGKKDADKYEKLIQRAMTLLFWPRLTFPKAQRPLHQGRKRLDIEFWNYAKGGFWDDMRRDPRIRSRTIPVECKNYSKDISNEEFDQLNGRFGEQRGFLGLLFYRQVNNEKALQARAHSFVNDNRGFLITISDEELLSLLSVSRVERDQFTDNFFNRKFRNLIGFN